MPLKRAYGTSRGLTRASTNFILRVHSQLGDRQLIGVGEAQPRRKLSGDITTDAAWSFFKRATRILPGQHLEIQSQTAALDSLGEVINHVQELAHKYSTDENRDKPFRGSILGIEIALLDLAAQALDISISELLGPKRDVVQATVRTLSTNLNPEGLRQRLNKQANLYPMTRVKGRGEPQADIDWLKVVHSTNTTAGAPKPLWIDFNESLPPAGARDFIDAAAEGISTGALPSTLTLEQPIPDPARDTLPHLQRYADTVTGSMGNGDIRIMADESLWDIADLETLHAHGGCRAINIKTAKSGGLLASLALAEQAVALDPKMYLCIGGMVGISDLTTWSIHNLAKAFPRLDYLTAVPPGSVVARITDPLVRYQRGTTYHSNSAAAGIGGRLKYEDVIPYVRRYAWYPRPDTGSAAAVNIYHTQHLRGLSDKQVDSYVLQKEALAMGLSTARLSPVDFIASDPDGREVGFSWTMSNVSSRTATAITSDKQSTRLVLRNAGVPVPEGRRFAASKLDHALDYARQIGYPVVFKPLRGSGGRSVVPNIQDRSQLEWAYSDFRKSVLGDQDFLIEEHLAGSEFRMFVLDNAVLSAVARYPGSVTGSAGLTIAELMLIKYRQRSQNPHLMTRQVKFDRRTRFQLERSGLDFDSVLGSNDSAQYTISSSFHQGGDSAELIDTIHPSILDAAVRSVEAIPGLAFAGVDFLMEDPSKPLEAQHAGVCELNAHPAQSSHEFPLYGSPKRVSRAIVTLACERAGLVTSPGHPGNAVTRLRVHYIGNVEKYADWFRTEAERMGITIKTEQPAAGVSTYTISGSLERISALSIKASIGPRSCFVSEVDIKLLSSEP